MYGYTITINGKIQAMPGDICYNNIVCSNKMIKKFEQDKIFVETGEYIVLLDGFVLNRKQITASVLNDSEEMMPWHKVLIKLYEAKGETFFSELRGSFSGALYDKEANKWIIFGDQIGSKFTFYAKVGNFFCVAEEMGYMFKMMKENGINYSLSSDGAYLLLTFGFMIEDKTLCEQVKKIQPGCYIVYENNEVSEKRYYTLDNTFDTSITEKDAVDIVDEYFRKAVERVFTKDTECGYEHICALSGGLDSRMTSLVAHDLGFTKQLNYTFSQTDFLDESIPKKIAADFKHEWIFKALDNGLWLYAVDDITKHTGGNVLYYGSAHSNSIYRLLNFDTLGIIHTGQISGGLNGSSVSKYDESFNRFDYRKAMYSTKYYNQVKHMLTRQLNQELGWYYYRCLNGTCYGTQIIYNYTESYSPFLDIDFLDQLLRIPISYRMGSHLYKKWILEKYPLAAKYEWAKTGKKLDAPSLHIGNREIPWTNVPKSIIAHIKLFLGKKEDPNSSKGMNPIAYYLAHNEELCSFLYDYFKYTEAIPDLSLRDKVQEILQNGTAMEKIQVVSLLGAIKLFFV